jgi:hypothetical protein
VRSRPALSVFGLLVVATALAAVASALFAELGPPGRPQPTLTGTPAEAVSIFVHNCRSLVVPLLLAAGRWDTARAPRDVADLVVAVLVLANPVVVGFALGRYPTQLPAYLPHLALEYAALAIAASAWLTRRLPNVSAERAASVPRCATLTLIVTAIAAVVETYAAPHKG